MEKFVVDLT